MLGFPGLRTARYFDVKTGQKSQGATDVENQNFVICGNLTTGSMAEKDTLHSLIHALTPSEKRYFQLFISLQKKTGGQNNYELLFDLLQQQDEYDVLALRESLQGRPLLKHLSSEKNYLYRLILKAMRNYRAERQGAQRARELLSEAEFLYDKSLFRQSHKQLQKARKIAEEMEDAPRQLEIQRLEGKLIKRLEINDYEEKIRQLKVRDRAMVRQLEMENRLLALYNSLFRQISRHEQMGTPAVPPTEWHWLEQLEDNDLPGFHARHLYLQVRALGKIVLGKSEDSLEWFLSNVRLWNQNTQFQRYFPLKYSLVLANYLNSAIEAESLDEVSEQLEHLRQHKSDSPIHAHFNQNNFYFYRLLWQLRSLKIREAIETFPELEAWLRQERGQLPVSRHHAFVINMVLGHLFAGNFQVGLVMVSELLNDQKEIIRSDFQLLIRLLQLILLWELGDTDQFHLRMRATKRFMQGKENVEPWMEAFLKGMRGALNCPPADWAKIWADLIKALESHRASRKAKPPGGINEILLWLRTKLLNRPVTEMGN